MRFLIPLRLIFLLAFLSAVPLGCARPVQTGDTSATYTPGGLAATAASIAEQLDWILPAVASAVGNLLPEGALREGVFEAVRAIRDITLPAFQESLDLYRTRGGGRGQCELYAASGALSHGLLRAGQKLGEAGWQAPAEILRVAATLGGLLDELPPRCAPDDAGFRAAGRSAYESLAALPGSFRSRGVALRPFPALR